MLNARQIEIFRAVMRHQSTVGAARELHVSQPAISNAIRHIEDQIGFPLFDRTGNRLTAREEAKLLYRESEGIFLLSRALNQTVEDLKADRRGHLRVVATPQLGHTVLPMALQTFLKDRPRVKAILDINQSFNVLESVETLAADFGLAIGLERELSHTFEMISLGEEEMVCLMPEGHPLAANERIGPADLMQHTFIGVDINSRLGSLVRVAFRQEAVSYASDIEVRFSETACRFVNAGVGVTIVDGYTARSMVRDGRRCLIRPFYPRTPVSAWAVHLRHRPLSRVAARLIDCIRQHMPRSNVGLPAQDMRSNTS